MLTASKAQEVELYPNPNPWTQNPKRIVGIPTILRPKPNPKPENPQIPLRSARR